MAMHDLTEALLNYTHLVIIQVFGYFQTTLMALNCPEPKAKAVLSKMMALDKLAVRQRVTLSWLKALVGNARNELADQLAKQGAAKLQWNWNQSVIPVSIKQLR
jgi:hypothetical protein